MRSKKQLETIFKGAKGDNPYYTFESFLDDARSFIKDIRNRKVIASMHVSRSGMLRRFNVDRYNMLLNICYNGRKSWDAVRVGGCGMDMWWYLLFTTCENLTTKKEQEKGNYNSLSSHQKII